MGSSCFLIKRETNPKISQLSLPFSGFVIYPAVRKTHLASDQQIIMMSSCHIHILCLIILIFTAWNFLGIQSGHSNKFLNGINNQTNRKLLFHGVCKSRDISISQSRDSTPGIPQYIVQIVNTCVSGCAPSDIHLHCGWFASAKIMNPNTFKRLSYDDCLVNGGKPLKNSQIINFTYSNSFMYTLSFKSADFCKS